MNNYTELFKESVSDFIKLINESDFIKRFFVILVDMIQFGVLSNITEDLEFRTDLSDLTSRKVNDGKNCVEK